MIIIKGEKPVYKEFSELKCGSVFQWTEDTANDEYFIKGHYYEGEKLKCYYATSLNTGQVINLADGAMCIPVDAEVVIK